MTVLAQPGLPACAQEAAAPPQVVVTGSQSDSDARRDFVAGKIVISRPRIEESGLRTVEQLLKREPAVTISGDGSIGLLNMPGYTQILVDGQSPGGGDSITSFDLARVEKIEIVKSSVAEFGPFGIAGTINIVTRNAARKTSTEASTGINAENGRTGGSASLSRNTSTAGSPLRTSFALFVDHTDGRRARTLRQTLSAAGQAPQAQSTAAIGTDAGGDSVIASSSLVWQRGADETISVSPELYSGRNTVRDDERRQWADGRSLAAQQEQSTALTMLSLPVKWIFKPGKKSRVEVTARLHQARFDTTDERSEQTSGQASALRHALQQRRSRTSRIEVVYKASLDGGHGLKMGSHVARTGDDLHYDYRVNGLPDTALQALGADRLTTHLQAGVFVQDEWRVSESVALNAGMSGAFSDLDVREGGYSGRPRYRLWSPSLHASKKIGDDDKRQWRIGLARSYRAPDRDSITPRPEINRLAPCPGSGRCGANTIATADSAGNLALQPEKALALNLSYEHGFGEDSQITVELFTRRIGGKFGANIGLETVPWADTARYVVRPANVGDARSTGLDVEFSLALRDFSETAPKVNVRGSVGLARSRVASVPGPDNRLDKQTPWSAKLGASYALPELPLKLDLDASWSPSVWVRSSVTERLFVASRCDLDASANWTISKAQRLVMGARAALPRTPLAVADYLDAGQQVRIETTSQRHRTLYLRFEASL